VQNKFKVNFKSNRHFNWLPPHKRRLPALPRLSVTFAKFCGKHLFRQSKIVKMKKNGLTPARSVLLIPFPYQVSK
jgi:hypothetical protein